MNFLINPLYFMNCFNDFMLEFQLLEPIVKNINIFHHID